MLSAVVNKEKTLSELKDAAKRYRALQSVRTAFCRCTNTTWEQACERFPLYTSEQRLSQFLSLSFKNIPESFVSYCQAALQKEHQNSSTDDLLMCIPIMGLLHMPWSMTFSLCLTRIFGKVELSSMVHIYLLQVRTFVYHMQHTEVKCKLNLTIYAELDS